MQIPALSSNIQSVLGSNTRNTGSTEAVANDELAPAETAKSTQVSGSGSSSDAAQSTEQSVAETTAANANEAAVSAKVVTNADELTGTSLGLNIDTTA